MKRLGAILTGLWLVFGGGHANAQTTETHSFTSLNKSIPDGNPAGLSDVRTISSSVVNISAVRVKLRIAGEFNGDLYGYVTHRSGLCVLLNRPGRTAGNLAGYDDAGLNITFDGTSANGDIHLYRTHATPAEGAPLTGSWGPDGRTADPGSVLDGSPRETSLSLFNGMDANGEWTLFLADMESGGTNTLVSWEIEVFGAAAPAITWTPPAGIVYGTPLGDSQLNASSGVTGTFTFSPPVGTVLNAGANQTLTATFTPANTASYVPVTTNVSITVAKAPLTVTAESKSKVYGDAVPSLTATYSGFANGDTSASLASQATLLSTATSASGVGTYPITGSGATSPNYTITFVPGTLTVTPAPLTITADNKSKIYGAPLPAFTATCNGLVNGDTEAIMLPPVTFTTAASPTSDVGTYAITPGGATAANYSLSYVSGQLTITKASVTCVVASSKNPAKPGEAVAFTFSANAVAPGAGTPTGNVQFKIDGSEAGTALLSGSLATFSTSWTAAGTHSVVANYAGDINFNSCSAAVSPDQFINTPPVAGADTIVRYPTNGVKVTINTLLANDSDADAGDAISLVSVSTTSAHGGTVTVNGQWIFYTPALGWTTTDTFTYVIADRHGATATGTVTVDIQVDLVPSPNLTLMDLGYGQYQLRFNGIPGRTYTIQWASSFPTPDWQFLHRDTANALGVYEYTDSPPQGTPQRFYRSVYP